MAANVQ